VANRRAPGLVAERQGESARYTDAVRALELYADELSRYPNVTGIGIQEDRSLGDGSEFVLAVYVREKVPTARLATSALLPTRVKLNANRHGDAPVSIRIKVVESGDFSFT
jgi:hypothetical protein